MNSTGGHHSPRPGGLYLPGQKWQGSPTACCAHTLPQARGLPSAAALGPMPPGSVGAQMCPVSRGQGLPSNLDLMVRVAGGMGQGSTGPSMHWERLK